MIGQENAGVFPAETGSDPVFKQAAGADDQRVRAEAIENTPQLMHDLQREVAVAEDAANQRVFPLDVVDRLVLLATVFLESIEAEEILDDVTAQVIRLGNGHAKEIVRFRFRLAKNAVG